jgi:hypothetical protein
MCEYRRPFSYIRFDVKASFFRLRPLFILCLRRKGVFCYQRDAYLSELYSIVFFNLVPREAGQAHLSSLFYHRGTGGNCAVPIEHSASVAILWSWILEVFRRESLVSQLHCALAARRICIE